MRARIAGLAWWLAALSISGLAAAGDDPAPGAPPAPPPAAAPATSDPSVLTLERIFDPDHNGGPLTGPLLDGVSWRPKHDEWTEWRSKKKDRALWLVDAESGKERRLVGVSDFDEGALPKDAPGVEMRGIGRAGPPSYVWAPTGEAVFVTLRGDVFRFDVATGAKIRCTETKSPISDLRIAPDGLKLSFCRDHDLWAVVVEDGKPRELRLTTGGSETIRNGDLDWVYPEELDCQTAAWWSPDSTRVAFLQLDETKVAKFPIVDYMPRLGAVEYEFYPKAGDANPVPRVGVVGLDGKPPVWMRVGEDTDVYVPWIAWQPGGQLLWIAVLDRSQMHLHIRQSDASTAEIGGTADFVDCTTYWVDVPPPPLPIAKRKAFLLMQRDLWSHPRLVSLLENHLWEGMEKSLTPEGTEVGRVLGVSESTGDVYYEAHEAGDLFDAASPADVLHVSIWRTTLDAASPVRITDGRASHHASFSDSAKWFLDTESRATVPPKTTLRKADGTSVRVVADSMTPQFAALRLEPPVFGRLPALDTDGKKAPWLAYMIRKPPKFDPTRKYPVIVHTYGGPGARLVTDEFGGGDFFGALLAQEGFVVFTLDNDGSGGRGKLFEVGIYGRLGKRELEDQLRGVEWLKSQPWVDGSRIGIWGWSYGGYMTCYAMTRAPDVFKAGVAVAPVTDWRLYDTIYTERYMGLPKDNEEGYKNSSPITFAKDLKGALLLCHGLSDDNVHVQNTIQLAEALIQAKKPFDLMLYPHRHHGIEGAEAHLDVFRRILEHFRKHL